MLLVAIGAYFCITLFAAFFLREAAQFWMLAICVGLFQGGIQALSRPEFGKLIPKEHANSTTASSTSSASTLPSWAPVLVSFFAAVGRSSLGVLAPSPCCSCWASYCFVEDA